MDVVLVRLTEIRRKGEHLDALLDEALGDGLGVETARHAHADELAAEVLCRESHVCEGSELQARAALRLCRAETDKKYGPRT